MNKQELLEEIVKLDIEVSENYPHYDLVGKEVVLALIDQLEEPAKLVIPQFVADWIEECKEVKHNLYGVLDFAPTDVEEWLFHTPEKSERVDLIARAWLDGYEVEKEKRYHVVNKENYFMLRKYDGLVDILHISSSMSRDEYEKDTRFMLTEQEIKDYDKRFWAFAEEVTE